MAKKRISRKPMSESDYIKKIKGLEEKVQKLTDRARPTGLTKQSEKYGKSPKAKPMTYPVKASSPGTKTMTYSPGKRKAISDFITGRPNISTRKINTMLSSKINKPGGMGMGTKSKSNAPGGMAVPKKLMADAPRPRLGSKIQMADAPRMGLRLRKKK